MENTEQAPVVEQAVEETNLPSEEVVAPSFDVNPDDLQDGKFQGKWSNPQEMSDHIKSIEDKYANLKRDVTNQEANINKELDQTAQEMQLQQKKLDTVRELAPQFIENGMVVTDEMKQALLDTGLTEMEIKVGAYEMKEAQAKNASYVGGEENWNIIMDYHAANMSDDEKRSFNVSLENPQNHEALMVGLQAMYERDVNKGSGDKQVVPDRIRGDVNNGNTIKPYASKQELLRDKRYADSRVSSASDKAKFRARFNATPDDVWHS